VNPYDILEVGAEASEEEIKKRFRMLSVLVHPDKCRHDKAADAFDLLKQAYSQLMDPEKRRIYQRVMREAKERVEYERKKENARRKSIGQDALPEETFNIEVQNMCKRLFEEIEERKQHFERLDAAYKRKKRTEAEKAKVQEEILKEDLKAWEDNREKRVESWRNFSDKKSRLEKRKKTHFGIKAPPVRQEERPDYAKIEFDTEGRPLGINEDYKKQWR
jgi:DnaJ family protein C protein 8